MLKGRLSAVDDHVAVRKDSCTLDRLAKAEEELRAHAQHAPSHQDPAAVLGLAVPEAEAAEADAQAALHVEPASIFGLHAAAVGEFGLGLHEAGVALHIYTACLWPHVPHPEELEDAGEGHVAQEVERLLQQEQGVVPMNFAILLDQDLGSHLVGATELKRAASAAGDVSAFNRLVPEAADARAARGMACHGGEETEHGMANNGMALAEPA
mmetsp:Transcript_96419/g.229617  ORF Transcript_96419/g.229617 Transcript_96419/m.229617 type:complete len:211 (+) Transcript_96419:1652-2284(+)